MANHSLMRLGKKPARHDPRTLAARKYLLAPAGALPAAKPACDWLSAVPSFPMYGNDVHGDCTIAAVGHMVQVWSANVAAHGAGNAGQGAVTPSEDEILRVYQILSPDDEGCVMLDVLNYWRQNPVCGVQLGAFVKVNPQDPEEVKVCLDIFGGLYGGAQMPIAAQTQDVWDVDRDTGNGIRDTGDGSAAVGADEPVAGAHDLEKDSKSKSQDYGSNSPIPNSESRIPEPESRAQNPESPIASPESRVPYPVSRIPSSYAPGSWGGHAIPFGKYDASLIRCVTWGAVKDATWPWLREYVDELYALISPDWLDGTGKTPEGLNIDQLRADLQAVTCP